MGYHSRSIVTLKSGDKLYPVEYPQQIMEMIKKAKAEDDFVEYERPLIPTGQKGYFDPRDVESVVGDR